MPETLGSRFGRPDMERIGLFAEMPYMHGVKYIWQKPDHLKGRNMIGESAKLKAGKTDCYFDKEFKRIFTGESIKGRGRKQKPSKLKPISQSPFMPSGGSKKHSTPGDYYGTFEKVEHFSPIAKKLPPYKRELRNFITNPGKKGSYGYNNICITPYPSHSAHRQGVKPTLKEYGTILNGPMVTSHYTSAYFEKNPYLDPPNVKPGKVYIKPKENTLLSALPPGKLIPTGPGKLLAGCKCGGFEKYPEYQPDKYFTIWDLNRPKKHVGGVWFPQSTAEKTLYTFSVVSENTRFRFAKPDLERIGIFSEMPYLHGTKYVFRTPKYTKGINMLSQGLKVKAGKQDCYFDKTFKRIFIGESIKGRGSKPKLVKFKLVSENPFRPIGESKKHSTPGDYYGTFNKFEHFSPKMRKLPPYVPQLTNFMTSPGKKGGYGYNNICLNLFPEQTKDRYRQKPQYKEYGQILNGPMVSSHYPSTYFDKNPYPDPPNVKSGKIYIKPKEKEFPRLKPGYIVPTGPGKSLAGCKCGGFGKFPEHKPNKYITITDLTAPKRFDGKPWQPQSNGLKTFYTVSILNKNVDLQINESTERTLEPTYTKYLLAENKFIK